MHPTLTALLTAASLAATATAQSYVVAPAGRATTDALAYEWIAGASRPLRQQTLVGQSHLVPVLQSSGQLIEAIELRRNAAAEIYYGGSMDLAVTLSTAPTTPADCSNVWGDNVGNDAVVVFQGTVTLPFIRTPYPSSVKRSFCRHQQRRLETRWLAQH